ncbi:MAG: hypothetical protein EU529_13335 [Promethearchaeota archaeon]|nr:MAG: hypothetical protein EU529_13335 [Candidatus Lokiarchaeota archaeon]
MTTPKKKEEKGIHQLGGDENLFFDLSQEIIMTSQEAKLMEKSLKRMNINDKVKNFSKSNHQFYKKLKNNNFIISLEELEKL